MQGDVIPRQSHHTLPSQLEIGVTGGVALAIAPGSVELEAVELDRETLLWPEGIDFVYGCFSAHCSMKVGLGMSVVVSTSALKRRSSSLFWVLGS